tara:strand:+ start:90 stop:455 length:366 start_codon:yes stop_codon:yes gene_type:complete
MKYISYLILFLCLTFDANSQVTNNQDLVNKISKNIRCITCQGQSVYDSQSEFSESIKILIIKKIQEGKSEQDIYDYLVDRYGEWIIFEPKFNKNTFLLWVLPFLFFIIGGFLIFKNFRVVK